MNGKTLASIVAALSVLGGGASFAQDTPAVEKEAWKAPFGGTFAFGLGFFSDYSYRGISQTQRQVAVQGSLGYE
ncbi:MAG: TorF family putative porin, partial [Reyranella sp.]|nr:TorF family putative porin [Reyranella sp.]MDP3160004.1 TorF family putative porin [Reyranella sp.]